jgi:hypothetical protein
MRTSYVALYALAQAAQAVAFLSIADALAEGENQKRQGFPDPDKTFNATAQHVSNTGDHAFRAPDFKGGDVRGPCPGLNAMGTLVYLPPFED